jgi:DNA polymerase-3 subunit gamma/tau
LGYNRAVMASQVFYRKWRPQSLADFIGQEHVTKTLLNALANERVSHAYLFCGPRGTGKTTTARNLAKAINCLTNGKGEPCNTCAMCQAIIEGRALDVIEVDAASNRGIDEIRDLREKVNYAPNMARRKVYIIDEVHMLTKEASNALLKTLEEPPPHVVFVLATTEPHKLLPTILSRCQRFDFHRYTMANTVNWLSHVCEGEGIHIDAESLKLIARSATGSMRDALNLLQQLNTQYGNDITLTQVQAMLGISGDQRSRELVKHIVAKDVAAGVATINNINSDGLDLRQFNRDIVEYLRLLLLIKTGSSDSLELTADDIKELKELAARASISQVLKALKRFGQLDLNLDNYSTLPLEMAMVECALPDEEKPERAHKAEPEPPVKKANPIAQSPAAAPKVSHSTPAPKAEPHVAEKVKTDPAPPITKPAAVKTEPPAKETVHMESPLAAGSAIEQLQAQWNKIINDSPNGMSKTPAAALLRTARPREIKDDTLVIEVKYAYHKEKMDILENQKTADKIVSSFMGRPCKVRCVYEHENNHLVKAALNMGAQVIDAEGK